MQCNDYRSNAITRLIHNKQFMLCNPYVVPEQWLQCELRDYVRKFQNNFQYVMTTAWLHKIIRLELFVCTVRAEIITKLILESAGPVISKTFSLEFISFRLIPVICPAGKSKPGNYWKR